MNAYVIVGVVLGEKIGCGKACMLIQFCCYKNETQRPFASFQDTSDTTTNPIIHYDGGNATNIEDRERLAVGKDVGASNLRQCLSAAASLAKVDSFIGLLLYFPAGNSFVSAILVWSDHVSAAPQDWIRVTQEPLQRHGRVGDDVGHS